MVVQPQREGDLERVHLPIAGVGAQQLSRGGLRLALPGDDVGLPLVGVNGRPAHAFELGQPAEVGAVGVRQQDVFQAATVLFVCPI